MNVQLRAFACSFAFVLVACSSCGSDSHGPADGGADAERPIDAGPARCDAPSECVLASRTCCGVCTRPTADDVVAVLASEADAYEAELCEGVGGCPPCAPEENPNLQAVCDPASGRCEVLDIEQDDVASCSQDADCVVRVPDCCACGADTSPERLVALNASAVADYLARVCDPDVACGACEPGYPPGVEAWCDPGVGRCRIRRTAP